MPDSAESSFVQSPNAKLKRVGSGVAVYVQEQKAIHVLNPTAQLLFELLAEPVKASQLVEALVYATDGDPDTIAADVAGTLEDFSLNGLIVEAER